MTDDVAIAFRRALRLDEGFALEDRMTFEDVPGWDSVGHMNLVSELETSCGVSLSMEDIIGMDSVGAVRNTLRTKRSA